MNKAFLHIYSIQGSRETVVDFTSPYYLEATTMVSPAPALRSRIFAIFSPFTYQSTTKDKGQEFVRVFWLTLLISKGTGN
ncbi:hypothetical protein E2C01_092383 [Portunus trituberculatus]|uniref:Uncharacterized protein n=1 Tax=Portunus trituberculatus TaxID=210409 RepID=A0A5B7JGB3_PORTR|nr:hypothetical protein [Portunus trituberculatus]